MENEYEGRDVRILSIMARPGSGSPWEWRPWEWRSLGMVAPGNGSPWEWRPLGMVTDKHNVRST